MPLRSFVQNNPETLSDVLLAAADRYMDAEELLVQGRFDGAVYLLGYCAEMWLKAVCLSLRGGGPALQVKAALAPLRAYMKSVAPYVPFTDYHDLSYLSECVTHLRAGIGRPLAPALAAELHSRVGCGVHSDWIVDMRYRRSGLTATEAWTTLVNVWWVKTNWIHLM